MARPPTASGLQIPYESEDFPPRTAPNTIGNLPLTWDEILWAAVTMGRPNTHSVFQYGEASYHEALFRLSAVRLAVEQRGPTGTRLWRTAAHKRLDPTEKGAVSYFLGMTFCKVFAARLLQVPWLLHLDVFGPQMGALLSQRSRPDLIGQHAVTQQWYSFECKGRASAPNAADKAKAKTQAQRIVSVGGAPCALHVAAFTFTRSDRLEFYWRDPPAKGTATEIPEVGGAWRYHYQPVTELWRRYADQQSEAPIQVDDLDISVTIHPLIAEALLKQDWARAHALARQIGPELKKMGYQPDGIAIRAGKSWTTRFRPTEGEQEI